MESKSRHNYSIKNQQASVVTNNYGDGYQITNYAAENIYINNKDIELNKIAIGIIKKLLSTSLSETEKIDIISALLEEIDFDLNS